MEIYVPFRWALILFVTVSIFWPANVPLVALAYKIRLGQAPLPFEPRPFWWRSAFAALGLCVLAWLIVVLDVVLVRVVEFPAGPVHLVLFLLLLPAAVWYLFVLYAMEDLLQALSVFTLFVALPGMLLLFVHQVLKIPVLEWAQGWFAVPS